jgi:long-subunit acyl-CoA synthetase (AMP-forming)
MNDTHEPTTLCAAFQRTAAADPDAVALRTPADGSRITWRDYAHRIGRIAAGLAALGVARGDTVALMLTNRPEFHLVDTAAIHLGATPFSIYNTNPPKQIEYQLTHADTRVVVCEQQFLPQIRAAATPIEHIVCVDGPADTTIGLHELEAAGQPDFDFDATWRAVQPSDVLTLIYTSGTTGPPKGVELTHANLLAEIRGCEEIFDIRRGDRITSYLPSAHIADRLSCHYLQMTHGTQITCVADTRGIAAALPDARPTIWVAVPRIWEKLKLAIDTRIRTGTDDAIRTRALNAIDTGLRKVRTEQAGQHVPQDLAAEYSTADRQVLGPLRAELGLDQTRWAMSGAAALAPEILEFFLALGIPVCEIWGMSETVGAATVNPPGNIKIGSVGVPLPGVQLRIADDGEALLRGPIVMRGYRNDPQRTTEAFDDDGWLHTGDIVTQNDDGYVTIVDRKKELIINAAGKNMSPTNIENTLKAACPALGTVVVIGDRRPYNVALMVLDEDVSTAIAHRHHIADTSPAGLAAHPVITQLVQADVDAANAKLSRIEQIKRFRILPDTWQPGGDELTATMKLRRKNIAGKYATTIDSLYDN